MSLKTITAAAALAVLCTETALAQEVTLRLSHWVPATHPTHTQSIEPWAESISQASDGRIKIQIFPAQQLGTAPNHYDMTRDRIVDFGYTNPGYQAGRFPIYSLAEMPFLISNAPRGAAALHEWYAPLAETEMKDVKFCLANPHDPGTIHSKVPIMEPGDIKGLNVRPADATISRFISLLGGGPVQVPAPEAREAIANGVADAITFPWGSIYIFSIDSETKQHLDMPFYSSVPMMLMNKTAYAALPDDLKQVIDNHCTPEWSEKFSVGWAEAEASGRERALADPSHSVNAPTAEQIQMWRDAAQPLLEEWKADVAKTGADADAILSSFIDRLKAHDALY
ncbi:MAG: TRAP transporter substrate-binding protein [Qingshengfaniella sp.]